MRPHRASIVAIATLIVVPAAAQQQQPPMPRPCAAIRIVCQQAGFVPQGARQGEGLIVDCIRPIMMGTPQPQRATKPLPAVDPALVEACRAQNPNFGMGNAAQQQMQGPPGMQGAPGAPGMQGPQGAPQGMQGPPPNQMAPQDGPGGGPPQAPR
jgi:hypothetical protein